MWLLAMSRCHAQQCLGFGVPVTAGKTNSSTDQLPAESSPPTAGKSTADIFKAGGDVGEAPDRVSPVPAPLQLPLQLENGAELAPRPRRRPAPLQLRMLSVPALAQRCFSRCHRLAAAAKS